MAAEFQEPAFLVLDASTRDISVGILCGEEWLASFQAGGDALETIFRLTDRALKASDRALGDLQGVIFCAGPGSLLGLRLAAIAVSTWQSLPELAHWNLRQYHSLGFVAARQILSGEQSFHVLSPFRRDQFNYLQVHEGNIGPLGLLAAEEVASLSGTRYFIPNGTLKMAAPENTPALTYSLDAFPQVLHRFPELFPSLPAPVVHVPVQPSFALWTAERHRGASSND